MNHEFDVIVIGGGAAGLSAALVLSRALRHVLVVDAGQPRNGPAARMHGFLSRDGFSPADLLSLARDEVIGYGGTICHETVVAATRDRAGFQVELSDGGALSARRLMVTAGLHDEIPEIDGLRERWARDVLHCPYCHGHEVRDQRLGVLGGAPGSARYAQIVRQWSHDVVFFAPPGTLSVDEREQLTARAIGIVEGSVARVETRDDRLCGIHLVDGRRVHREALFVPPRFVPNNSLLTELGCATGDDGFVAVAGDGRTSVPGIWAAGNVADPRAQVITAAGQGSAAAISINADLVDEDVRDALRAVDPVRHP